MISIQISFQLYFGIISNDYLVKWVKVKPIKYSESFEELVCHVINQTLWLINNNYVDFNVRF